MQLITTFDTLFQVSASFLGRPPPPPPRHDLDSQCDHRGLLMPLVHDRFCRSAFASLAGRYLGLLLSYHA